jgi:hypothetical protein
VLDPLEISAEEKMKKKKRRKCIEARRGPYDKL